MKRKNEMEESNIPIETIAETDNYEVWSAREPDGEMTFHVELGTVTLHFFREEWEELLALMEEAIAKS